MSTLPSVTKPTLMQEVAAKSARLNIPLQVDLELTYRCNLRCVHCYIDLVERDELSFQEWQRVLEQLKAAGTLYLLFTGGEITMRADFLDIVTYARRSGFCISLLTNCTLVTPAIAQAIAELKPFSLGTSLYGASAASHESVTRVPGSFQRTLEGIRRLVSAGLVPTVQVALMKTNLAELPQIEQLIKSLGATPRINAGMAPSKTGAHFPFQYEPGVEELAGCGWQPQTSEPKKDPQPHVCKAGKGTCSISPHGEISPCIMFPMKLGGLRQSSFDSIWRLEPCAELQYLRSMRRSDLYACRACQLRGYCWRCTGSAYLESGRMDGPSPSACRRAQMRWRLTKVVEVELCQKKST